MKVNKKSFNNIREIFIIIFVAQLFTVLASFLSNFINGLITGNFLSAGEMVALGLIAPLSNIIGVLSSIIAGGAGILCGRYMGRGEGQKVNDVFSITIVTAFVVGVITTLLCFTLAPQLALVFGSTNETLSYATSYIRGISLGFIPTVIVPCYMTFLQMSNKAHISLISTIILAVFNCTFGLINVKIVGGGIFGMGVATTISQFLVCILISLYFYLKKNIVTFNIKLFSSKECFTILKLGFPASIANVLYNIRNIVINSTVLLVGGIVCANALAILGSFGGFMDSFNIAVGAVVTMLASVFIGEKDSASVKNLSFIAVVVGELCTLLKLAIAFFLGRYIAFFFGASNEVADVFRTLLIWYAISSLANIFTVTIMNTYASKGKSTTCILLYIVNCLIVPFICLFLSKVTGDVGYIWKLYFLAEVVTLSTIYIITVIKNKKVAGVSEILTLNEGFEADAITSESINSIDEVINISQKLQNFCLENNIDNRRAMLIGLCVEEMAGNIVNYGFGMDKKENTIDIFASINNNEVSVRLRDNCVPFDPHSQLGVGSDDPTKNIGIKMVFKVAKEMNYQITFGMNILTIKM